MPSCPASSRCHGRPLARTASSVRSSTGLPPSSARSLEPVPPDATKRSPRPEARTSTTGCGHATAQPGAGLTAWRGGVLALDDLRHDRNGDLGRRPGADAQSHRAVQARQFLFGQAEVLRQPDLARRLVARRPERAHIERIRIARLRAAPCRRASGSWVSATTAVCASGRISRTTSSGMPGTCLMPVPAERVRVFLARIAHQHFEVEHLRHLRHGLRQLAGADQQQPPASGRTGW